LTFEQIDKQKFPVFEIIDHFKNSASQSDFIAFNVSNEIAVDAFLNGKIEFLKIVDIIGEVLGQQNSTAIKDIDDVFAKEKEIRKTTLGLLS
jgi:1-deoxy-D-xylulose-5-phosphate reductoisomerase